VVLAYEHPSEHDLLFVDLRGDGVRDIARVSDGFLILSGPVGDRVSPHHICWWNGRDCVVGEGSPGGRVECLAEVPAPSKAKPEGLAVLREREESYDVVIMYDSADRGALTRYRLEKPSGS
jgi:hypothetical protein